MMTFRTLALPISSASSVTGAFTTVTSLRSIRSETMELLRNRLPPFLSVGRNFASDGPFITIRSSITSPSGAPMSSSEMTT